MPVVDPHHDHDHEDDDEAAGPGSGHPGPGSPVSVAVTGTARGADGWAAAMAPYQLDCLTVQDPVVGWLVDDVAVTVLPPPPPAAD